MKYLPKELKDDYDYAVNKNPNISDINLPYINIQDVLKAHYILADYFTDELNGYPGEKMLAGVRDSNLLYSAICRQIVSNGEKIKYRDPLHICATLFFGLTKDHAFHDGNKRTALLILIKQLTEYGYYPIHEIKEFENLVESIAENKIPEKYRNVYKKFKKTDDPIIETIAYILRRITEKKDRSFHLNINMKEFCQSLKEKNRVEFELENSKIKFKRTVKVFLHIKEFSYVVKFYGWTRPIEAGMARDTFDRLGLIDEYPTFNSLINGDNALYTIIQQFEMPLRRLKDK